MTTLVFHSSSLGVTEYDAAFTGLAGDDEALATGVYRVGSALDVAASIVSSFGMGIGSKAGGLKQVPRYAYVQADSASVMNCDVATSAGTNPYAQQFLSGRMRRFVFGRGIRDNYLGFTFSNPDGEAFRIDQVELEVDKSSQRKV